MSRRKPTTSAVLIPVPEAEPVVEGWRSLYDASAAWGVPAHITLLSPFVPPDQLDGAVLTTLTEMFAATRAFDVRYERAAVFPGVLYLAPEPDAPFRALTARLGKLFPEYPPYGGAHDEVVPHLTVVDVRKRLDLSLMKRARLELERELPVATRVTEAWLMIGNHRRWTRHSRFELSGG